MKISQWITTTLPRQTSQSRQSDTRREFLKAYLLRWEIFGVLKSIGISVFDAYLQTFSEKMQRISVIGCCGAGKSTLAQELHATTNLPLIHLDKEFWTEGWTPSDKEDFQSRMSFIYDKDEWIIDGHYFSTMDARLQRSDAVFHLDYSTPLCLFRVFKRMIFGLGRDRADCAEGCPERFDWEFVRYVASFRRTFRDRTIRLLEDHKHLQIYTFKSPRELQSYLINREQDVGGQPATSPEFEVET